MAATTHDGQIDDSKIYTTKALAHLLGKSEVWVTRNVIGASIDDPCPYRKVGHLLFISGYHFRLWIERTANGGASE